MNIKIIEIWDFFFLTVDYGFNAQVILHSVKDRGSASALWMLNVFLASQTKYKSNVDWTPQSSVSKHRSILSSSQINRNKWSFILGFAKAPVSLAPTFETDEEKKKKMQSWHLPRQQIIFAVFFCSRFFLSPRHLKSKPGSRNIICHRAR